MAQMSKVRCNVCKAEWEAEVDPQELHPKTRCPVCRPGTRPSIEVVASVLPKAGGENPPEPTLPEGNRRTATVKCESCGYVWTVAWYTAGKCPPLICLKCGHPQAQAQVNPPEPVDRQPDCTTCARSLTCHIWAHGVSACPGYERRVREDYEALEVARHDDLFQEFGRLHDRVAMRAVEKCPHIGFSANTRAIIATGFMLCDRLDALLELMQEPEQPIPDPVEQKQAAINREQERRRQADEAGSKTNSG